MLFNQTQTICFNLFFMAVEYRIQISFATEDTDRHIKTVIICVFCGEILYLFFLKTAKQQILSLMHMPFLDNTTGSFPDGT